MTRPGSHEGAYHWGGGGVDIGRQRFDEIMSQLFASHEKINKIQNCLPQWRHSPDYSAMREAFEEVKLIHRSAISAGRQVTRLQLIRAGHQSRRLKEKAIRTQAKLWELLRNAPPPEPVAQQPKVPLGGLSLRERSGRPLSLGKQVRNLKFRTTSRSKKGRKSTPP